MRLARRTPPEMDALRARMIREGYPLSDLTTRDNARLWKTLTEQRRWSYLQRLTGMTEAELSERVREIRRQYKAATDKR